MDDVRELLRQVWEGTDFTAPTLMLRPVTAQAAIKIVPGCPYSIATNVAHADIWQRQWLGRMLGQPKFNPFPDFPLVEDKDWAALRDSFLGNFEKAVEFGNSSQFIHSDSSDEYARKLLTKIAVHNAYHIGQVALLKRLVRATGRAALQG